MRPNNFKTTGPTGEFRIRAQQRYDDTDILVSELLEWGYDCERGRRSFRRINQQHGRFDLDDEVIASFGFERPSGFLAAMATQFLRLRACLLRFLPKRRRPRLRTQVSKMDELVKAMGGEGISKSQVSELCQALDARVEGARLKRPFAIG